MSQARKPSKTAGGRRNGGGPARGAAGGHRGRRGGALRRVGVVVGLVGLAGLVAFGFWEFGEQTARSSSLAGAPERYGWVQETTSPRVGIGELLSSAAPSSEATVEGQVVDMGPTMGCWLVINDGTGELLVQTDPMVYVDQAVNGKTVRATGRIDVVNGGMGYSGERLALLTTGITVAEGSSS